LSPDQVCEIRSAYEDKVSLSTLAARYGVSRQTAHRVATGRIYADVVSRPKIAWFDPTVRFRGFHNDDELRAMANMLRSNPGKWALVKQNRAKPDGSRYEAWGLEASAIQTGGPGAGWSLYVRFPRVQATANLAG
jgi:hypothetical protein